MSLKIITKYINNINFLDLFLMHEVTNTFTHYVYLELVNRSIQSILDQSIQAVG